MASTALSFIFSVTTLSFASATLFSRSSFSPFLIPSNLKLAKRGLSVIANSTYKSLPSNFENDISISEIRLCRHNLVMALPKTSVPGMVTLSPTARPDIEIIRFSSKAFVPVTFIPAIMYSFGILEVNMASSSGFTDTGRVSIWAKTNWWLNSSAVIIKNPL